MKTKSENKKYELDLVEVTCTCRDFKYRKSHYPQDDLKRLCKHLQKREGEIRDLLANGGSKKVKFSRAAIRPVLKHALIPLLEEADVMRYEFCGSWRRGKEEIGDIDILIIAPNNEDWQRLLDLTKSEIAEEVLWEGEKKFSFKLKMLPQDIQVDYRRTWENSWVASLLYFTGSKGENIRMRTVAIKKGMKLNEYGLQQGENQLRCQSEEDVYRILGEEYVKPQDR